MYPPSLFTSHVPRLLRCGGGGGSPSPVAPYTPAPPAPTDVAPVLLGAAEQEKDGTNTTAQKLKIGKKKLQVRIAPDGSNPASPSTGLGVPST